MISEDVKEIVELLEDLSEDQTVPRNVKAKFREIISTLKTEEEVSMQINKALSDLDEIGDDTNLQPFVRTQIWNVVSLLERVST